MPITVIIAISFATLNISLALTIVFYLQNKKKPYKHPYYLLLIPVFIIAAFTFFYHVMLYITHP